MKKEIKNNGNNFTLPNHQLKFNSSKNTYILPSLEIVIKKEIKEYENKKPNAIYSRNKLKPKLSNYRTYTNTQNIKNNYQKIKNLKIFTSNKISSTKKKLNHIKFLKINALTNKNLTESRIHNKAKIRKKNCSQSPNSMNIFDLTINNNNEKKVDDKSFASMNINHKSNKIDNLKNLFNIKGEEKYREDFINTQLYRHRKQRINFDNKFIYFKNYNLGNYLKNNINKRYNTICGLSQNSGDDFNLSKNNQKNKYDYLLLSNSGYNNKMMNSEMDRDINCKIDDNVFKINWQKTRNKNFLINKNQLHLSSSQFQKENNILNSNTFKNIAYF